MTTPNDLSYFSRGRPFANGSSASSTFGLDHFSRGGVVTFGVSNAANFAATQSDAEGLTDAMSRVAARLRTNSDALGLTDAVTALNGGQVTKTDILGLTDSRSRVVAHSRTITDLLGETDVALAPVHALQVTINDQLHGSDGNTPKGPAVNDLSYFMRGRPFIAGIGKAPSLGLDVFSHRFPLPYAVYPQSAQSLATVAYARSRTDPLGATDNAGFGKTAAVSNPLGMTDGIIVVLTHSRVLSDSLTESDTGMAAITSADPENLTDVMIQAVGKPLSDAENLTDVLQRSSARALADPEQILDSVSVVKTTTPAINNPENLTDVSTRSLGAARTLSNPANLTDVVVRSNAAAQAKSDAQQLTDSVKAVVSSFRVLVDSEAGTDAISLLFNSNANIVINDPLGARDASSSVSAVSRSKSDSLGMLDAVQRSLARSLPNDAIGMSDSVLRAWNRALNDALHETDAHFQAAVFVWLLQETIRGRDTVLTNSSTAYQVLINDAEALLDHAHAFNTSLKRRGRRGRTNPQRIKRGV